MEIYFVLLLWSLITAAVFYLKNYKAMKIVYVLLNFIPMGFICGLRSKYVGTDTLMYHEIFNNISNSSVDRSFYNDDGVEIGYVILNKFISAFYDNSQAFMFAMGVVTVIGFGYFIYKNSNCIWLSTFLFIGMFFYLEIFNTTRQCFAAMILCNSYIYLKSNKKVIYLITVLIAMCFHLSAVVFLPFILITPITSKKVYIVTGILMLFSLILYFMKGDLIFALELGPKYAGYLMSEYAEGKELGAGVIKVVSFLFITVFYFFQTKHKIEEINNAYFLCVFIFCACVFTLAQYKIFIFYRFIFYFSVYMCLLLPLVVEKTGVFKYWFYVILIIGVFFYLDRMLGQNLGIEYDFFY